MTSFLTPIQKAILGLMILIPMGFSIAQGYVQIITPSEIHKASKHYSGGNAQVEAQISQRLQSWQQLVNNNLHLSELQKLTVVNNFFNKVNYAEDRLHWRLSDYWASPIEFLATNAGDCEDYSIAKYFTLIAMGVPESKLLITYVKALSVGQAHMVLTYYPGPGQMPLVLDNMNPLVRPASERTDLAPVYSFNGGGLWLARERGRGASVPGGTDRLKSWNDLNQRLRAFQ